MPQIALADCLATHILHRRCATSLSHLPHISPLVSSIIFSLVSLLLLFLFLAACQSRLTSAWHFGGACHSILCEYYWLNREEATVWPNGPRNVRRISVNVCSNLQCNCLSSTTTLKGIQLCFYYSKREREYVYCIQGITNAVQVSGNCQLNLPWQAQHIK